MKALILNSGMGSRMGDITKTHPKCMTEIYGGETILSRQLRILEKAKIKDVVITTGYFEQVLVDYCNSLNLSINIEFVKNPMYEKTNYIYSIYCAKELLEDDILLMHGDLVFDESVIENIIKQPVSCMKVSSTLPIPKKDFKAVIKNKKICAVGVDFFDKVMEAQALYKLDRKDWEKWLNKVIEFCENNRVQCYAEDALNEILGICDIYAFDIGDTLCTEIDNHDDLEVVCERLKFICEKRKKFETNK